MVVFLVVDFLVVDFLDFFLGDFLVLAFLTAVLPVDFFAAALALFVVTVAVAGFPPSGSSIERVYLHFGNPLQPMNYHIALNV